MGRTRDPKKLLREVSTAIRLQEIEDEARFREEFQPHWSEQALLALLFVTGLLALVTIWMLAPKKYDIQRLLVALFSGGFVVAAIMALEYALRSIRRLRAVLEWQHRRIEALEDALQGERKPEPAEPGAQ